LYSTVVPSSSDRKPWAKPGGIQAMRLFSADSTKPADLPKVGEPRRMSTATSKMAPSITRMSLPCACWI
jgi:hypothetical protein